MAAFRPTAVLRPTASEFLRLSVFLLVACSPSPSGEDAPPEGGDGDSNEPAPNRVVGYLPTYRNLDPAGIHLDALSHLCIAFANPTGEGNESDFEPSAQARIAPLVEAAHERGVQVLASIAGGTKEQGELVGAQIVPEQVDAYISGLLSLMARYDLDGIDVDIEGAAITETYEPFVKKLRAALPSDKLLTAAVATKHGGPVPKGALSEYDFVNLMAYDHCSWADDPCVQASLEGAQEDLDYWTGQKGVPRRKLVLGVPFYGWCWGCSETQSALTYAQILGQYPEAKTDDWIENGNVTISLNSESTIREKTELGQEYGGLMIWELGQDAAGDDSLLGAIAEVGATTEEQ